MFLPVELSEWLAFTWSELGGALFVGVGTAMALFAMQRSERR